MAWEQRGEQRHALIALAQCTTLLNSSQGMQAATGNLSERGLWLFYINLHYRTVVFISFQLRIEAGVAKDNIKVFPVKIL